MKTTSPHPLSNPVTLKIKVLLIALLLCSCMVAWAQPTITCPSNITLTLVAGACNASVTVPTPVFSSGTITNDYNLTANASGVYGIGETTITWTATNAGGSTSCTMKVIINPSLPIITCGPDITLPQDAGACHANITVTDPVITDVCKGYAMNFNGSQSVNVRQDLGATNTFTYELWVKPSATHEIDAEFLGSVFAGLYNQRYAIYPEHGDVLYGNGYQLDAGAGISVGTNGVSVYTHSGNNFPAVLVWTGSITTWTHIAVVFNNRRPTLFINGVAVRTGIISSIPTLHATLGFKEPGIGAGGALGYVGELDEVRVWNYARTGAQITADMNRELAGTETGLKSYLNFNEGTGSPIVRNFAPGIVNGRITFPAVASLWTTPDPIKDFTIVNSLTGAVNPSGVQPLGTKNITWTTTDRFGQTTSCNQKITVQDTQVPVITASGAFATAGPGMCQTAVTVPLPVVTDCSATTLTNNYTGTADASGIYPVGTTNVVWTATDAGGLTSTKTITVTITDTELPVIVPPAVINANTTTSCNANVTVPPLVATDNCNIATIVNSQTGNANATGIYPVGTSSITWTVTDVNGNIATASQTIMVNDNTLPTIVKPADISVIGSVTCNRSVTVPALSASDNCSIASIVNSFNGTNNASGLYPVGSTVVTWTVTDVNGNVATETQTINVLDTNAPVITSSGVSSTASAGQCQASVTIPSPGITDCSAVTLTNNYTGTNDASGDYPVGITNVVWTATDASGNQSTLTIAITITENEAPVIPTPATVNGFTTTGCNGMVMVPALVATDNCAIATITNSHTGTSDATGSYPLGSTIITWTVTDIHGNSSTATQTITVVDNVNPVITNPSPITVTSNTLCEYAVNVPVLTASDNCGVASVVNSFNGTANASGTYPVGQTTITWTVTDNQGNVSTATQLITVIDGVNPVITLSQATYSVSTDAGQCGAFVTIAAPSASDNCAVASIVNSFNGTGDASGNYAVGTTTVTWTVTDVNGNVSTANVLVTVTDNELAIISPISDVSTCDPNVTIIVNVQDNCGVQSITNSFNGTDNPSGMYPAGTTNVVVTVKDIHNNTTTTSFKVTILTDAIDVSAGDDQIVCSPSATLDASVSAGLGAWTVESGTAVFSNSSDPHATVTGLSVGINTLRWTGRYLGCTNADVVVLDYEDATVKLKSNDEHIKFGQRVTLTATTNVSGVVTWSHPELLSTPENSVSEASPVQTTDFIATLTSEKGCVAESILTIVVDPGLLIPNGLSFNGDDKNERWIFKGMENYGALEVSIYNRSGDLVFQAQDYKNDENAFAGRGNRGLYLGERDLPTGTYFYLIKASTSKFTGYLEVVR